MYFVKDIIASYKLAGSENPKQFSQFDEIFATILKYNLTVACGFCTIIKSIRLILKLDITSFAHIIFFMISKPNITLLLLTIGAF